MSKFLCNPAAYNTYRLQYPASLFEYLKKISCSSDVVLDCGSGSGQAAFGLSSYYKYVISTDLSFELLSQAVRLPNIFYVQSRAELLAVRSQSVGLICVAQAMHWFGLDDFYKEVRRILKPGGVIAAWCYNQSTIEPAVDALVSDIYTKITSPENFSIERQYVYESYRTIPFPFERVQSPEFEIKMSWNLNQLLGYIGTWPGVLDYQKKFGVDIVSEAKEKFMDVWGDSLSEKIVSWPLHLLVGKVAS